MRNILWLENDLSISNSHRSLFFDRNPNVFNISPDEIIEMTNMGDFLNDVRKEIERGESDELLNRYLKNIAYSDIIIISSTYTKDTVVDFIDTAFWISTLSDEIKNLFESKIVIDINAHGSLNECFNSELFFQNPDIFIPSWKIKHLALLIHSNDFYTYNKINGKYEKIEFKVTNKFYGLSSFPAIDKKVRYNCTNQEALLLDFAEFYEGIEEGLFKDDLGKAFLLEEKSNIDKNKHLTSLSIKEVNNYGLMSIINQSEIKFECILWLKNL